ncbi:MAG: Fmu (Sun) domain-containing protein [Ginsengibacter sp.]
MNGEISSIEKGNHFHRYLGFAISLIENYNGKEPFHLYLKKYFSLNKKHGSRDRKIISSICYGYFRLGLGVSSQLASEEKLLLGIFLTEDRSNKLLQQFKPDWNEKIAGDLNSKIEFVQNIFDPQKIFPFKQELSRQIDAEKFNLSFLIQPKLFIRIRPGKEREVLNKLKKAEIDFEIFGETCLAFENNQRIEGIFSLNEELVIQDFNSQQTENLLKKYFSSEQEILLWDCCAASGGKSILAKDLFQNIKLTVSDTRKGILQSLKVRFHEAGITNYSSFIADLSEESSLKKIAPSFDVIIADVPCSGSGTWSRTPADLLFFQRNQIQKYAALQKKIVFNTTKKLEPAGYLLYITCSVFAKENEENVKWICEQTGLKLIESGYLKGYEKQADTLFAALFRKE